MRRLAAAHGIHTVLFYEDRDEVFVVNDGWEGRSAGVGDEIWIGSYADPELRLLSFFHEVGHTVSVARGLVPDYEEAPYQHYFEAVAWKVGLELAAEVGVSFSDGSLGWAREQLGTYFGASHELTPGEHLAQAIVDAGLSPA